MFDIGGGGGGIWNEYMYYQLGAWGWIPRGYTFFYFNFLKLFLFQSQLIITLYIYSGGSKILKRAGPTFIKYTINCSRGGGSSRERKFWCFQTWGPDPEDTKRCETLSLMHFDTKFFTKMYQEIFHVISQSKTSIFLFSREGAGGGRTA